VDVTKKKKLGKAAYSHRRKKLGAEKGEGRRRGRGEKKRPPEEEDARHFFSKTKSTRNLIFEAGEKSLSENRLLTEKTGTTRSVAQTQRGE